jgi:hypothetical protein
MTINVSTSTVPPRGEELYRQRACCPPLAQAKLLPMCLDEVLPMCLDEMLPMSLVGQWGVAGTQGSAAKRVATLGCAPKPLRGKDKHDYC